MSALINWELLYALISPPTFTQSPMWDAFADRYNGYVALQADYTRAQIDALGVMPEDSLLDVGAGPGRIAIPAAGSARSVTALDVSRPMLDHLERNAAAAGLANIRTLHMPWSEVVPGRNVEPHDIVVAARSPAMHDLKKLDALARKRVYVTVFSGPSLKSFHDSLVEGIEPSPPAPPRPSLPMPSYALIFNRLVDMGVEVGVFHLPDGFSASFSDWDDLFARFAWLGLADAHRIRFRENISRYLTETEAGLTLRMETRATVLWWPKSSASSASP